MKGLVDTHAHLDFPDFEHDLPHILDRAAKAGVEKIITIGTGLKSSLSAIHLAERYPQIYAAIGIHPGNVEEESEETLAQLEPFLGHPKVAAVGECGTDYHYLSERSENESPEDHQQRVGQIKNKQSFFFRAQLEMAARHGLNIIVHQRDSWEDTVRILGGYTGRLKAVFHCFGGSHEQAAELFRLGHLVSFTGIITFKNAEVVRQTARSLPPGSYMIETDCPYLAPVPFRGKRCEPAYVAGIASRLSEERKIEEEELREELWRTSHTFFRLGN